LTEGLGPPETLKGLPDPLRLAPVDSILGITDEGEEVLGQYFARTSLGDLKRPFYRHTGYVQPVVPYKQLGITVVLGGIDGNGRGTPVLQVR
jgi:hypothetical protein